MAPRGQNGAMGDLVNLRRVKKQRARVDAASAAETQRLLHGRTTAQKRADAAAEARLKSAVDQALLDEKQTT